MPRISLLRIAGIAATGPAGQHILRLLQVVNDNEGLHVGRVGVDRHDAASETIVAVIGSAMPGEAHADPIILADQPGQRGTLQLANLVAPGIE